MARCQNRFQRVRSARAPLLVALSMAIGASLLDATPASAASLAGPIPGWQVGTEPDWVSMYAYVPDNVPANAPILVVVHFCSGNAVGVFNQAKDGGIVAAADQYGFIMVLPQTTQNCWDVATTPSLTHDGGGDLGAIVHQVDYAVTTYGANRDRVYVTGTSSGAMVTQAISAAYPDVFKGGVAFAGVPSGCWSVSNPDGQWSAACAGGQVTHTAEEWGEMARAQYPGYSGYRPRLQLWHGDADSILSPVNQTESVKQWTNVLGLSATPTSTTTETIDAGQYTREQWQDSCGETILDVWTQAGGPHGTDANMNGAYSIPFLALDQPGATDPQVDCVPSASGGGPSDGAGGGPSSGGAGPSGSGGGNPVAAIPSRPTMPCSFSPSQLRSGAGRSGAAVLVCLGLLALVFGRKRQRPTLGAGGAASELSR
jgi:acetylxylan esterase